MTQAGKTAIGRIARFVFLVIALPSAVLAGFGRIRSLYVFFAQFYTWIPGLPGDMLRAAYYSLVLEQCSPRIRIAMGSIFVHRETRVAANVSIGSYCVIGRCNIGGHTLIGSGVHILSGAHQHARDSSGRFTGEDVFTTVSIGSDCWIGSAAVILADVGPGSTVAAAAVVASPVPPASVVAGNPARILRSSAAQPLKATQGAR